MSILEKWVHEEIEYTDMFVPHVKNLQNIEVTEWVDAPRGVHRMG